LGISPKTYYKYRGVKDSDYKVYKLIKHVFDINKKVYGYRRIGEGLLKTFGLVINHKKVARIMNKYGVKPEYIKQIRPNYGHARIDENVAENKINRVFTVDLPNKVWSTDITYLIFGSQRAYLSTIIDLYDRKVVSSVISHRNDMAIVINTLNQALENRKNVYGLILHSDQGYQYTSYAYKAICEANGITISMSRKGNPVDNSPIESFHSILKKETIYNNDVTSLEQYIGIVKDWLRFYNHDRIRLSK